ncbi:Card1-like endonuclease domain-containing protein [Chryseobacterium lactis]|uniref:Card1-like endonuclease domain-containing protein n=1 Tax=Chryseobacterium lactis TaxID=1241981 RepID=UPI00162524B1|nr:DUF1887 family CARF protein [Chryseobacterium lactis]
MKHHISLVGGQTLPLYLGIIESNSDFIHFVYSKDSAESIKVLKEIFKDKKIKTYECNAFNHGEILTLFNSIVLSFSVDDDFVFNITGGTKLMALAATEVVQKSKGKAFYFNQDLTYYEIPSYEIRNITNNLEINDFIKLSDNKISSYTDISIYKESDFKTAQKISNFSSSNSREYSAILRFKDQKFGNSMSLPLRGDHQVNNNLFVSWDENGMEVNTASDTLLEVSSNNIHSLFFNAGWWELLVAQVVNGWKQKIDIYTNVILPYKNEDAQSKNEIDVLVNTGKRLVFIECKSGNILASDINKMKAVRETYGGRIARSLLVSKYKPTDRIIEKCKELDIDIFYCYENSRKKSNDIGQLINTLDELILKSSI